MKQNNNKAYTLIATCWLCLFSQFAFGQCIQTINYNSTSGWRNINNGGASGYMQIKGNKVRFIHTPCGCSSGSGGSNSEIRVFKPLTSKLNDSAWSCSFAFEPYTNNTSDSTGAYDYYNGMAGELISLTSDSTNWWATSCGGSNTNNNAIIAYFASVGSTSLSSFGLKIVSKDSTNGPCSSSYIPFSTSDFKNKFYCKLERLTPNLVRMSVFTDSAMTSNKTGSPVYMCISSTINKLNYIQHGAPINGSSSRIFSGTVSNVQLNNCSPQLSINCNYQKDTIHNTYSLMANTNIPMPGFSFSWSPSTGLSATTGDTVTANPGSTTTYTVTLDPSINLSVTNCSGSCTSLTCSSIISFKPKCVNYIDYSIATGWTFINSGGASGNLNITGNKVRYIHAPCGCGSGYGGGNTEIRAYKPLFGTLNDSAWKCSFAFSPYTNNPTDTVGTYSNSYGTGGELISLTSDSTNWWSTGCTGTNTNNNALVAYFASVDPADLTSFGLKIVSKNGTGGPCSSQYIPFKTTDFKSNFYCAFERLTSNLVRLSVFTDSSMLIQKSGSPVYMCIPGAINNLSYIQHGLPIDGSGSRNFSGTVSNVTINNCTPQLSLDCNYTLDSVNHRYVLSANPNIAIPGLVLTWTPSTGLTSTIGDSVYATPSSITTYTVTLDPSKDSTSLTNCSSSCTSLNCSTTVKQISTLSNNISLSNTALSVFPNPTSKSARIVINSIPNGKYTLVFYDAMGNAIREIFKSKYISSKNNFVDIDLTGISNGLYYIRLLNGSTNIYTTVIKQD